MDLGKLVGRFLVDPPGCSLVAAGPDPVMVHLCIGLPISFSVWKFSE
jgi:hypothetical protein